MPRATPPQPMDHDNKRFVARILNEHRRSDTLPQGWDARDFQRCWDELGLPQMDFLRGNQGAAN